METLKRTFYDQDDRFFADQTTWSMFDADSHKKYQSEWYYKAGTDEKMEEPERYVILRNAMSLVISQHTFSCFLPFCCATSERLTLCYRMPFTGQALVRRRTGILSMGECM